MDATELEAIRTVMALIVNGGLPVFLLYAWMGERAERKQLTAQLIGLIGGKNVQLQKQEKETETTPPID